MAKLIFQTVDDLKAHPGEYIGIIALSALMDKMPQLLVTETKKTQGDGSNGTTVLRWVKETGKKYKFTTESALEFIEARAKKVRSGLGRGPNPEGRLYSIRLTDAQFERLNAICVGEFNKAMTDVNQLQKTRAAAAAAKKKAEAESTSSEVPANV